ncbi:hypothetical protein N8I74_15545 [Chitiniphilus purpureus]|uniref:Uncharacterized protein n=1 Tax=Chitiniphilus purpureus TaxID=2981137 RepID=A0ABY6DK30_9NEIS|nr:hypothetical protein [Chitiniphilus sp. CD1]UXY14719.1 hypothetical protein N8I74_15545 [Chitiniphilus sp. CD1]
MALKRHAQTALQTLAVLAVAGFAAQYLGWLTLPLGGDDPVPALQHACPDLTQGCTFTLQQRSYRLASDRSLAASRIVVLTLAGDAQAVTAEWRMQGMTMPPSHSPMQATAAATWQLRTALPLCSQARRDWQLWLRIDDSTVVIHTRAAA